MVVGIDLYRTDDYVKSGRVDLSPLLRMVFEPTLGQSLDDAKFSLNFHAVTDLREIPGQPAMVNLRRSHGFVTVRIARNGRVIYRHPHSLREIIARPLQQLLAGSLPEEKHWGFGIAGPGLEHVALVRPAPQAEGSVDLRVSGGRPRRIHVEGLPDPDPPLIALADLQVTGAGTFDAPVGVVFSAAVHEALLRGTPFSDEVEEGGFLIGEVYREQDRPDRYLVHVTQALPAERTGASMLQFTFTGESFLRINEAVSRLGPDMRLVGWYHTHLFPATKNLGLSTIDVELHTRTFLRRWHVAGLLNLDGDTRQLRAYGWDGETMRQLPFWVGP